MSDSISLPPIELNRRVLKITSKQLPTRIMQPSSLLSSRFELNVDYQVLLYMFLMMFSSIVYRFIVRIIISMLKHLESMCLELGFNCVLVEMCPHMSSCAF